jgi:two-component system cell cycle response regulator DivK
MDRSQPAFLYIEDHPASRRVMEMLLVELLGFTNLTMLADSDNLIGWLENLEQDFDIVFLDLHIRPLDGYDILTILRDDPHFQRARFVAMTAGIMPGELVKIREAGFDGLIGKPINHDTFQVALNRLLNGKEVWGSI